MKKHEFNIKTSLNTKVVLLTHYGFNIELSTIFELYVKSTLSNTGTSVDSTVTRR